MYVDCKVWVIVFLNLVLGMCLYYQVCCIQVMLYFLGYFGLWEIFNVFIEYEDVEVILSVLVNLLMFVDSRGVQGSDWLIVKNGQV